MTQKLRLSVVLCTCNGGAYLGEQLVTLLTQSRLPDEVIVSDDASTDLTWEIVEDFAALARTRGIAVRAERRPERLGYVMNFSQALALATGDIVFLCDQDDAWHPDKMATMEARFVAAPQLAMLHTDARLVGPDGSDLGCTLFEALALDHIERERVTSGHAFDVYLRRNIATGATMAFRHCLLEQALPVPSSWVHDAWLATLASARGNVGLVDDPLIDYRQHGENQIGMTPRTWTTRIAEFRIPRGEELRDEVARLDVLARRLAVEETDPLVMKEVTDRRAHLARRIVLGERHPLRRLYGVAREWATGRYARFATGHRTALRDLLRKGG